MLSKDRVDLLNKTRPSDNARLIGVLVAIAVVVVVVAAIAFTVGRHHAKATTDPRTQLASVLESQGSSRCVATFTALTVSAATRTAALHDPTFATDPHAKRELNDTKAVAEAECSKLKVGS